MATGLATPTRGDSSRENMFDSRRFTTVDNPLAPPLPPRFTRTLSILSGINSRGTIVGWSDVGGFILDRGVYAVINASDPVAEPASTTISGINASGTAIGYYYDSNFTYYNFLWNKGVFTPLEDPDGYFLNVSAINDSGVIAGYLVDTESGVASGFTLKNGVYTLIEHPLADPAAGTVCYGINASGAVVGAYFDGKQHSFVFDDGVFTTVDAPQFTGSRSVPFGISDSGTIVGFYNQIPFKGWHGYIAEPSHD